MLLTATSPSLPRPSRTPVDRLVVAVGSGLEAAGRRLAQAQSVRIARRSERLRTVLSLRERQDAAVEHLRDNAAQVSPLGLR